MKNISVEPVNENIVVSVSAPKDSVSVSFPPTENAQIYSELAKKYCDDAAHFSENAITIIKNTVDNIESGLVNSINAIAEDLTNIDAVNSNKTNIDTVVSNLSGINTLSENLTNINAVNSNKTNIDTVAINMTKVDSVLNNMTNINTVAENISAVGDFTAEIDRIDQSKGKESGSISTNADILEDVKKYAHSTFDESKFTKVGSPTITSDGIVSGFSGSNYLKSIYEIPEGYQKFDIKGSFTTPASFTRASCPLTFGSQDLYGVIMQYSYSINKFAVSVGNNGWTRIAEAQINTSTKYYYRIIQDDTRCYVYLGEDKDNLQLINNETIARAYFVENSYAVIGNRTQISIDQSWLGSIDLKQFSISIDGVPVFSGNKTGSDTYTLNGSSVVIPYTLSKTGSKIVDSAYRTEVAAVYNEFGYAPYYTLSDTDFTLPAGELYGMIARNGDIPHIVSTYKNGASWYRVWSDGWKEQGGLISMSQQEATLAQPVLGANGTIGGTAVAVTGTGNYDNYSNMYYVLGSDSSSIYRFSTEGGLIIYFPYKVKLTRLEWNRSTAVAGPLEFKVSNDNINWVDVTGAEINQTNSNCYINTNLSSTDGYQYYYLHKTNSTGYLYFLGPLQLAGTYKINVANTVTFPLVFSDTNYSYTFSCESGSGANAYISSKTTSGMSINNTEAGAACWTAMGY